MKHRSRRTRTCRVCGGEYTRNGMKKSSKYCSKECGHLRTQDAYIDKLEEALARDDDLLAWFQDAIKLVTGRTSSKAPNFQAVPMGTAPDFTHHAMLSQRYGDVDYTTVEQRVAALVGSGL